VNARRRVDRADGRLDRCELVLVDQVGLVDNDDVGEGDLVLGLAAVFQSERQVLGVDQRHNGVEPGLGAHVVVHEKSLRHRHGIGQSGGFDHDGIEPSGAAHEAFNHADQVAAHRAAHAAIVHLVDFLVGFHDQLVVDADFAEFVDDHGVALAVVFGEDAVEQRRLAGTEIAGQHGDGKLGLRIGHQVPRGGIADRFPYRMAGNPMHAGNGETRP
jgi:hypothetical protein